MQALHVAFSSGAGPTYILQDRISFLYLPQEQMVSALSVFVFWWICYYCYFTQLAKLC